MADFPTPPFFETPLVGTPYNFGMKLTPAKTRGMGYLPYGENFIILTSTVIL